MVLRIERGLFDADFVDYHAILGVSVDSAPKDIRKRYYKIAQRLHPDRLASSSDGERQLAQELLSKLVNPAWEKLSKEKDWNDYQAVLKLKGQFIARQQETVVITGDPARRLAASSDLTNAYQSSLKELSSRQYDSLSESTEMIGLISELNMVYLMRREGSGATSRPATSTRTTATTSSTSRPKATTPAPPPPPKEDPYVKRAKVFMAQGDTTKAIHELREGLSFDAKNSECHSLLAAIYLKNKQQTMAKIHATQALKYDPKDETANAILNRLNGGSSKSSQPASGKSSSKPDSSAKKGGGLFGGLFGGKKK